MAVKVIRDCILKSTLRLDNLNDKMHQSIIATNREIYNLSRFECDLAGIGALLTSAIVTKNECYFIQIGDTRGYLIRDKSIIQLTEDQTIIQQLIKEGKITNEEAETHPLRNIVAQAIGICSEINPAISNFKPRKGDIFLSCTGGLSKLVRDGEILRIIKTEKEFAEKGNLLVKTALENGGYDNITVILARLS